MNMFIKIVCSIILFLLSATSLRADHIVGGHIEMQAIGKTPGKYTIILKLYFNALNPSNDVPNTVENVGISQKSNHRSITVLGLPRSKQTLFEYSNEDCARLNRLKIIEVTYETEWEADPENFQDPAGYYIYHDRCCRNAGITNIVSSHLASMAFYTEFPPMKRSGKLFLNSTPAFNVLSGEYVCINDHLKWSIKVYFISIFT